MIISALDYTTTMNRLDFRYSAVAPMKLIVFAGCIGAAFVVLTVIFMLSHQRLYVNRFIILGRTATTCLADITRPPLARPVFPCDSIFVEIASLLQRYSDAYLKESARVAKAEAEAGMCLVTVILVLI